ncbi:Neurofibromin [Cytospora mali]|uniref:Neurofibromin n=1 Tax=Cytospora mali TaxID=578113 RepID=A0A194V218_CYTMA|nr:Neurofibromin [Valsa mali var. pyri (nom. inval.)]
MNADGTLVGCLVERLTTRLPHRTGTTGQDLAQDEIVLITRSTLLKVSIASINVVLDALMSLLEDLGRPYKAGVITTHPPHVLVSEFYILGLIADCCTSHWNAVGSARSETDRLRSSQRAKLPPPHTLDGSLVVRILEILRLYARPLPEGTSISNQTLLDEMTADRVVVAARPEHSTPSTPSGNEQPVESETLFNSRIEGLERQARAIAEFVSASNWTHSFEYLRKLIYMVRTAPSSSQNPIAQASSIIDDEHTALVVMRLIGCFWVDGPKLGLIIQELCSSYLHFRRPTQHTIAIVTPLLITRWLDRYPEEFVQLHTRHKRLDGGPDTLFDMTQTVVHDSGRGDTVADSVRRRFMLYPLQTTLLFLLPDVFEVASNMREAKSGGMSKKVAFLDGLRKALRNRNEQAAYCLVLLLRAARHFDLDSDSAFMSYALDVQDEIRDAVFRRNTTGPDNVLFEQDIMTAAFVSVTDLNYENCIESLALSCLAPTAPLGFKIAMIQASSHFARLEDPDRYRELYVIALSFSTTQLRTMSSIFVETYAGDQGSSRKALELVNNNSILHHILAFLCACPKDIFNSVPEGRDQTEFYEGNFESFLPCLVTSNELIRQTAARVMERILADPIIMEPLRLSKRFASLEFKQKFWKLTSLVLGDLCDKAASQELGTVISMIHGYLESRLVVLRAMKDMANLPEEVPERAAISTRLETLLLDSLCSANIETCQRVVDCFGLFFEECRIIETASSTGAKSALILLRNADIFREIGTRSFRFTGLVAFQKRIRGLLRRIKFPSAAILDAWVIAFERWLQLSRDVSTMSPETIAEVTMAEWRNYSGFLASLGGVCIADQAAMIDDPTLSGLRWIDKLSSENQEEPILNRYLRLSIQLLACSNVRVRETTRELLSSEISPTLYQPLFKALESELDILFTGALDSPVKGLDSEIIFAEQSISLLRALVERLDGPSDLGAASSVHLGALALNFAKFLDGVPDIKNNLMVRIKVCQLAEAVVKKKEHLNLRDDVRIRNQLLEYIFSWIARPRSPRAESAAAFGPARPDESLRIQRDLDKACLRSLAELTYRLPLQPGDGQSDVGASELKSQMFHTYFNRFLSLLNLEAAEASRLDHAALARDESVTSSELAITILSNLLSANIDVGLKHSLSIGYHENVEIRTAFVKVLYNILIQGTEFNNLSDTAVTERYEELLDLVTTDTTLAAAISAVCPSSEVDEVTISLLNIFEARGLSFNLLEALIKQEIEDTENESELLRRTCVATKMLSIYAKWKGQAYLKATLQKVLERLMLTSKDLDLELDPARVTSQEELQKNALQLRIVAKVFIDDICASSVSIPSSFRKICNIISSAVMPRFPEAKYTAVGAFIFLRFFCPAIVAPEVEGLVSAAPSKEMRRGLLLIAKVVQNLANNVLFGAKEPYMFPLNDFLTQNIYRVTTFLREISVAPEKTDSPNTSESFDFGSCVALHRFLYDHWDQVRQRLASQERRDFVRSPAEIARTRSPVLEPLRNLITHLGPPALAVTWNRPQISANSPPAYSRFQDFMLRNAFRGTESFVTARAVYDGGESKDGLSIICIILRNIEEENIDSDTLIYCYLKIASRLWHRPFGLLIDATCYNGQNEEPHDELFRKLELLTPTELSKQLSRIYIYNMSSAFRKCLRRVLRVSARNDVSVFNPNNIEYHLIGSIKELQSHFHFSQLHLPKETISVFTDTRYDHKPVIRLSKTKGRIACRIMVGSQFVQVTTADKQEIHPNFRLSASTNDVFRLGDVDEAPTNVKPDDDFAFGLRADNGKIVMYFTSPKKAEILQTIRNAKSKYGKDTRSLKSFERLIRPQDVPGTLLNLALTNLASPDHVLRLSSYNLLGALCRAFKFTTASKVVCTRDIAVPLDPSRFIVEISRTLAQAEPQLTSDFMNEFFVGWDSFSEEQKPLSLAYLAPWLPGLRSSVLAAEPDSDKGRDKIASLFRKLIDVTLSDPTLSFTLEQTIWPAIQGDEVLLDIFLEEVIKIALNIGLHDEQTETLTSIVTAIGSVTLRGKIVTRLRKALNRSSMRQSKYLTDNVVWPEVCILLQFCVSLSFDSGTQTQMFLPEIFHIVTMLANTGAPDIRVLVHRLLINSIHAACTSFHLDEARQTKLRGLLESLSETRTDIWSIMPTYPGRDGASMSTTQEYGPNLAATEILAGIMFEICSVAAPSTDMANAWRSRWMSLVASTAFQNNPAIQPRAFSVMGCLAREEVDDDLLYQVLVALRISIARFSGEDTNNEMLVAIVTALSRMMAKLPSTSRYGIQLFWLATFLLRLVPHSLFNCAAVFLESVLTNINTSGDTRGPELVAHLLQGREQLDEVALPLDVFYGIHFNAENFHFAVCACLVRGLSDTTTKATALHVLATFLDMTTLASGASDGDEAGTKKLKEVPYSPYLSLILSRAVAQDELKDALWLAGIKPPTSEGGVRKARSMERLSAVKDTDLLLNTAIELVDFSHLEDAVQSRILQWLNELAVGRPAVAMHLCGHILFILDETLLHCQNSTTLGAAHELLQTLTLNPKFAAAMESSSNGTGTAVLDDVLDTMGFGGLWRFCSLNPQQEPDKQCFAQTEKLIDLIINAGTY